MATMTIGMPIPVRDFSRAEQKAIRADAGLTFSQEMRRIFRLLFSLIYLTGAFRDVISEQTKIIQKLQQPAFETLTPAQYAEMAERLEKLVSLNDGMIPRARSIGISHWKPLLDQMEDQSEHLAGIAESFRTACDDEELAILAEMASKIGVDCYHPTGDPVGSLHD